jgi:hypothetical protein
MVSTDMVNTDEENIMLANLLERLAEMFPNSNYQSRLEEYIISKYPQSAGDIDRLQKEYTYKQQGTWL